MSGRGFKRAREQEVAPLTPYQIQLTRLIELIDTHQDDGIDRDRYTNVVRQLKRDAVTNRDQVAEQLVSTALQLSTKLPQMAVLIGLLNVESPDFVRFLVSRMSADASSSLANGGSRVPRLLLCASAALVVTGVVQASSVLNAMKALVQAAIVVAENPPHDGWQPYADNLVQIALAPLPFAGADVAIPDALQEFMELVDAYMAKRPESITLALRPFLAEIKEDDVLSRSDLGAARFLGRAVGALKEYVDGGEWRLESIPRVHMGVEATLATAEQQHELPALEVPTKIPVFTPDGASKELIAAMVQAAYPARGMLPILETQHTEGDRLLIERLIAEDYILDTVAWWEQDRVECAKRLANSLPLPYSYDPLLCEVLFSQMLRVPSPAYKPIMYGTLMVDLCKLMKTFPRAMSACVRECFARMSVMDPALRLRLAEWLAYHLSNFEYVWPWQRWQHVLEAPVYDAQRHFCIAVMNRMIRLSYWERIQSVLPEEFRPLLPPKPEVNGLPSADDPSIADDLPKLWAAKTLDKIRTKASNQELAEWLTSNNLEEVLGSKVAVLEVLARAVVVAGSKSYTHMNKAVERFEDLLNEFIQECAADGQTTVLDTIADVWSRNPQRACMTIEKLMTVKLLSPSAVIAWVFKFDGVVSLSDASKSAMAWEILYRAVDKTSTLVQDAKDELEKELSLGSPNSEALIQAKEEKLAQVAQTETQQREALLLTLDCFGIVVGDNMQDESGEQQAVADLALATLKSFLRRYALPLASISDEIAKRMVEQPAEVRDALNEYFFCLFGG